jgi:hypothetical protein
VDSSLAESRCIGRRKSRAEICLMQASEMSLDDDSDGPRAYAWGYWIAIVTVFEVIPPMVRTMATASPAGAPAGIWKSTW